ncbi:hypothetical protein QUF70_17155 [Desulfobacterales bacterium HSG17]|nr:hypothetical protein [Desulfobacterales bacterium HSG17]
MAETYPDALAIPTVLLLEGQIITECAIQTPKGTKVAWTWHGSHLLKRNKTKI